MGHVGVFTASRADPAACNDNELTGSLGLVELAVVDRGLSPRPAGEPDDAAHGQAWSLLGGD
ncbi:hypothetical protein QJS66_02955 [Kocuria rhizophila]|nr:hypothetical protein QJS66_02955 [Kocuria rhizophila]